MKLLKHNQFIEKYQSEIILIGILTLASLLFLFNLAKEGYSNSYYAAAVKSMLTNPGIILYNSYDPVGFVTIDKPPIGIWIQTISAAVLGYSGSALILPEALAGLCAVFLLYRLVSQSWGKNTGLCAAISLTITPIFVAVVRTNNMDGLLVFVLLVSLYLAVLAWRYGSFWFILGSVVFVGIGFNIKMVQAFAVFPACYCIYLLSKQISWKKKILHLCLASVVLLVISASWAVMMDLTPADQRPFIGSSQENSVSDLILGYNGLNRLLGGFGHTGMKDGMGNGTAFNSFPSGPGMPVSPGVQDQLCNGSISGSSPVGPDFSGNPSLPGFNRTPGQPPFGEDPEHRRAGMTGFNDGGDPGLFRMGDTGMSGQISWMIPFALIGLLAWLARPSRRILERINEREILTLGFTLWLVPELIYFSFTSGFYHTYYLVMVAIPLAGLVGIGASLLYEKYREPGMKGWLLPLAVLVTGIVQWKFCRYNVDFSGTLAWIIVIGSTVAALLLILARIRGDLLPLSARSNIVVFAICLLLVAPFIWSCTPVIYHGTSALPIAGPDLISGNGDFPGPNHGMQGVNSSILYSYLSSHQSGEKYLVGVDSAMSASGLIINYSAPVMAMGGFSGSDSILTVDSLKSLINSGEIRYFWLGKKGFGLPRGEVQM